MWQRGYCKWIERNKIVVLKTRNEYDSHSENMFLAFIQLISLGQTKQWQMSETEREKRDCTYEIKQPWTL